MKVQRSLRHVITWDGAAACGKHARRGLPAGLVRTLTLRGILGLALAFGALAGVTIAVPLHSGAGRVHTGVHHPAGSAARPARARATDTGGISSRPWMW